MPRLPRLLLILYIQFSEIPHIKSLYHLILLQPCFPPCKSAICYVRLVFPNHSVIPAWPCFKFCFHSSSRAGTGFVRKSLPRKDVVYRFLNQASFNWRKFLHRFALKIVLHFESLISSSRTRVFIVDDSVLSRNRSKKAELLARVFDHTTGRFTKGFNIVRIHGMRWSIETFFKFTKSYLKLGTEFQGRSFDMLISHTTVVFSRYLVMEFDRRQRTTPSRWVVYFSYLPTKCVA